MRKIKKLRSLLLLFPLLALLLTTLYFGHGFDRFIFHHISDSYFRNSLETDALALHFTLTQPEKYKIKSENASLPVYSRQNILSRQENEDAFAKQLSRIDPARLPAEEQYSFSLLSSCLEAEKAGRDFWYQEEPLSPSSGMHTELPLLLAEYPFRTTADVDSYLSLLNSAAAYLQGLGAYETEKSQAGLFMPEQDVEKVLAQCHDIMDPETLSSDSHFLQKTFESRLDMLCEKELLTESGKREYLAQNQKLLTEVLSPSYQKLASTLSSLSKTGQYEGGLCEKPDGQAYYAWLAARTTGSALPVTEMYPLLQKTFQKKLHEFRQLSSRYQNYTGHKPHMADLSSFPLTDPNAILLDLQQQMQTDFPALSAMTREKISCTIRDVEPVLEPYTSPAFFLTPPIDDLTHNIICINRSLVSEGTELYTTLAHEGYPGHLYQTVYSSFHVSEKEKQPVREVLYYGGYVEGWAYYAERLSYQYAASLLTDTDSASTAALLCEMAALQRDLQINLFCILDISLHYYGTPKADILQSLTSFGLPPENAGQIYDYIRTDPAVYLKYYIGYLEMTALKERARMRWGKDFSPLAFHRFVLEAGPSDFGNLNERLKQSSR